MIDYPKTIEEARKYRYGTNKRSYYEGCCAYEVSEVLAFYRVSRQCLREKGHGPANLYCKPHAGMIEIIEDYNV